MHRSIVPASVVLVCFYCSRCVKYVDLPLPEAQRLLMTRSWILAYTDSASIDNTNTVHYFRIPAAECEKKEPVSFTGETRYQINLVCDQSAPGELVGAWTYDSDSTLGYGLKTDTFFNLATLELVTADTLKLIQKSSFAEPENHYDNYVEKTYSR